MAAQTRGTRRRRAISAFVTVGTALSIATAIGGGSASPATPEPVLDYRFNWTLDSSTTNIQDLVNTGPGGQGFLPTDVEGQYLPTFQVIPDNGLAVSPVDTTGMTRDNYSLVFLARLDETNGPRRLIDFTGGRSDNGLYVEDGKLLLRPLGSSADAPVHAGRWHQFAVTRSSV